MNNKLILMEFGSTIYGTRTKTSDKDYKGVHLPSADEILLQQVRDSINVQTKLDKYAKNSTDDIDTEVYSLQRFLGLLMEGQTVALDMVFTPPSFYLMDPHTTWLYVLDHKDRFVHAGSAAFAGYCRTQANKYCLKGSRLAAARGAMLLMEEVIKTTPSYDRLADQKARLEEYNEGKEFANFVECKGPREGTTETHWEVCNRKIPLHATLKYAHEKLKAIVDEYGARAQKAEQNSGSDWKALSHAVRVCEEAKELMTTGKITFPRPEAEILLKIKNGEMVYQDVSDMIEQGLKDLDEATAKSPLRKSPDRKFADLIVKHAHAQVVLNEYGRGMGAKEP